MSLEILHEAFETSLSRLGAADASREPRNEAMAAFFEAGYPTRRLEAWRYTDLKPIATGEFDPTPESPTNDLIERARNIVDRYAIDTRALRLVFVDGQPLQALQSPEIPPGLTMADDEQTWRQIGELQTHELLRDHPLAALNTAFTSSGTFIRLARNTRIQQPLHLIFIDSSRAGRAAQPRVLIDIGAGSGMTIVQHYLGEDSTPGWTNMVTQVTQEEGSNLTLYRFQDYGPEHFHTELLQATLARDASIKLGYVDLGGSLVRNDAQIELAEPGASCEIFGVFLASQGQHVDNHTRIDHRAERTTSREAFRGIIGDRGRGVFNGKVVVHRGAQGADAQQSSDNLLLSERGEIDTKPELEIYTDDVKCAHGATVGELDAEQLFYLRSRGVDEATARSLLTFAFANDVLNRIEVPELKARVTMAVAGHLPDFESWGGLL